MSIQLVLALVVLGFLLVLFKRVRAGLLTLGLAIIFICGVGQGWITQPLLDGLQEFPYLSQVDWKERNAIVLLGSGMSKWRNTMITGTSPNGSFFDQRSTLMAGKVRLLEAARLYYACRAEKKRMCLIIATGGDPKKEGAAEGTVMRDELMAIGIPPNDVIAETESRNTFQNAKFSEIILVEKKIERTVLVTSGIHMKRGLTFFRHFGIDAVPAPSDEMSATFSWNPVGGRFAVFDAAAHEYGGLLQYLYYNWSGKNPPPKSLPLQN